MKKLLFLSILLCISAVQALAFDYTDKNGVTWTCSTLLDGTAIITGATNYSSEVMVPGVVYDGEQSYTTTTLSGTFQNSLMIKKVTLPLSVTEISISSFCDCSNLVSIEGTENVTCIAGSAFYGCSSLVEINIPSVTKILNDAFSRCTSLTFVNMKSVSVIDRQAFWGCSALKSVDLPNVTSIGDGAFLYCYNLESVNLPKVISIGQGAFWYTSILEVSLPATLQSLSYDNFREAVKLVLASTTPPVMPSGSTFSSLTVIFVPEASLEVYRNADGWKNVAGQILSHSEVVDYDVTTTAQENTSGLRNVIGEDNLAKVVSLKVKGTINGFDIMIMRNKMPLLRWLDLSEANIVANPYEYYTGYHTEDNVVGFNAFCKLSKLISIKLPNSATVIDGYAFCLFVFITIEQPKLIRNIRV